MVVWCSRCDTFLKYHLINILNASTANAAHKTYTSSITPTFMSFRRRNIGLSASTNQDHNVPPSRSATPASPGVRPSPLDGRLTTSTGTPTLDSLLAGHAGLALGTCLLIEENGTTDYAGALLRYFAAEGLVQGHHVHVVAVREKWARELPGLVGSAEKEDKSQRAGDKMKIAWRYEKLGQFESGVSSSASRGGLSVLVDRVAIHVNDPNLILILILCRSSAWACRSQRLFSSPSSSFLSRL
jgi:PAXNEB protein